MTVKGNIYSRAGPQESNQGDYLRICTHKFIIYTLHTDPHFQKSPRKKASVKTMDTRACLWPGVPAAPACLRLAGTQ